MKTDLLILLVIINVFAVAQYLTVHVFKVKNIFLRWLPAIIFGILAIAFIIAFIWVGIVCMNK